MKGQPDEGIGEAIALYRRHGCSIMDAIKAIRERFGMSLGEAKQHGAIHPAYREIAAANASLHDGIVRAFESD